MYKFSILINSTFTFIHLPDAFIQRLTIAIYVRGCMPLEKLGVKCLAQGHIGVSHWIQTQFSHTKGMCLIYCAITTPTGLHFLLTFYMSWSTAIML